MKEASVWITITNVLWRSLFDAAIGGEAAHQPRHESHDPGSRAARGQSLCFRQTVGHSHGGRGHPSPAREHPRHPCLRHLHLGQQREKSASHGVCPQGQLPCLGLCQFSAISPLPIFSQDTQKLLRRISLKRFLHSLYEQWSRFYYSLGRRCRISLREVKKMTRILLIFMLQYILYTALFQLCFVGNPEKCHPLFFDGLHLPRFFSNRYLFWVETIVVCLMNQ